MFQVAELSLAGGGTISVVQLSGRCVVLTTELAQSLGISAYGTISMAASDTSVGSGNQAPKGKGARQKGQRMTSQDDALEQLEQIEEAQRKVRQRKSKQIIDSIEKSKQRAKNQLKDIANDPDLLDDLD